MQHQTTPQSIGSAALFIMSRTLIRMLLSAASGLF
ncbi:hypothetical protein QOZ95_000714 [Paenibacillus brasilensis]|uniref:Uncharacterized protein n=1 Tax=Paenibacillus brasilensis TaxID=128574 RepID=A0ABU0KVA7_9BACL|nr:hypothetical protein [Paenibacillus brasilensis]